MISAFPSGLTAPGKGAPRHSMPNEPPLFSREAIEQSIPDRFEDQVRTHSGQLALVADGLVFTYGELNRAANQVASQILEAAVPKNETVVLLMRQDAPFVVAVLAALKAGKIYVPLDPDERTAQITVMAADAGAHLILTDRKSQDAAAVLAGTTTKLLTIEIDASRNTPDPGIRIEPDRPAYIYYTSGSTGRPKGVVDTHRNVLHNVMRYTNSLRIDGSDRLTLLQAPSFSGVVSSLFSALLNGAAIYPYDLREKGFAGLPEWIQNNSLTMYHSVPSIFRAFVAGTGQQFPSVRVIRLEGDQASSRDVDLFRQHFSSDCLLVNGLGTTETGLCRQFFVVHSTHVPNGPLPIGHPVEDMEVILINDRGDPVKSGEHGEIAVRSNYLASGYWQQPEFTAERFRHDSAGQRFYRTGDVGRWLDDDCLLHLGRLDSSVKIRGLRVELGDVERALLRCGGVQQAAVTAHQGEGGESYLVGHVVVENGYDIGATELRKQLRDELPGYTIPSELMFLDELPVTPQGKVDRRKLGSLSGSGRTTIVKQRPLEPRTPTEMQLVKIWSVLLRREEVALDDNFFDIGGHSLAAMRMLDEIDRLLERRLAPGDLMNAPTVRRLAQLIDQPERTGSLVRFQPRSNKLPFVWLPGADGDVFVFRQLADRLDGDIPVHAFEPPGIDGQSVPIESIESLAVRYVDELLDTHPTGPFCLGGYCFGGFVAYEMARQLEDRGYSVPIVALLDCDGEWRTISGWRDSLRYHLRNLRRQDLLERSEYVIERLSFRWQEAAELLRRTGARMLPALVHQPSSRAKVIRAARRASRGYMPPKRSREVVYLRSQQRRYADPFRFWGDRVTGIETREIGGSDTRLFTEPGVDRLADLLRGLMRETLTETDRQPPLIAATK